MKKNYIIIIALFAGAPLTLYPLIGNIKKQIKTPNIASTWYPAQKTELRTTIKQLTAQAQELYSMDAQGSAIRALIVPHAGYTYSGAIAAAACNLIKKQRYDRIIILGPSHFAAFNGIAIPQFNRYRIPLGVMRIDTASCTTLQESPLFHYQDNAFAREHSVEAELPFIAYFFPKTPIIPLIVGDLSATELRRAAEQLKTIITPSTLVIVSSDMTHYGSSFNYTPFAGQDNMVYRVQQLDSEILRTIQHKDLTGFMRTIKNTHATVCGRTCINILLELITLKTFDPCTVRCVAYGTSQGNNVSQQQANPPSSLVTYASLIITQETTNMALNMFEKQSLLHYARTILEQSLSKTMNTDLAKPIITLPLEATPGVFVTLYTNTGGTKKLRGCIGNTASTKPLYENVADMTRAAAFNDPRFAPVQEQELADITLEISVLQPPHAIASYKDIVLNTHGIILSQGNASALFLPKVPQEFGFNLEQTLTELSRKAGLPDDAWQSDSTKFQVFETVDF